MYVHWSEWKSHICQSHFIQSNSRSIKEEWICEEEVKSFFSYRFILSHQKILAQSWLTLNQMRNHLSFFSFSVGYSLLSTVTGWHIIYITKVICFRQELWMNWLWQVWCTGISRQYKKRKSRVSFFLPFLVTKISSSYHLIYVLYIVLSLISSFKEIFFSSFRFLSWWF